MSIATKSTPLATLALGALTLLTAASAAPAAYAGECGDGLYNHNGSRMDVHVCGRSLSIVYDRARAGIRKHGVRNGTLLVRGNVRLSGGKQRISGTAHVFKRGCGATGYSVTGWLYRNGRIVLNGRAPVRGSGCQITRYRNDRLVFNPL